jgi:hypothetical protein
MSKEPPIEGQSKLHFDLSTPMASVYLKTYEWRAQLHLTAKSTQCLADVYYLFIHLFIPHHQSA